MQIPTATARRAGSRPLTEHQDQCLIGGPGDEVVARDLASVPPARLDALAAGLQLEPRIAAHAQGQVAGIEIAVGALIAVAGGRAYWRWFHGTAIGETALAMNLDDAYLTSLIHGYTVYLHPYWRYNQQVAWHDQDWPTSWIARDGELYLHLHDLAWAVEHTT